MGTLKNQNLTLRVFRVLRGGAMEFVRYQGTNLESIFWQHW